MREEIKYAGVFRARRQHMNFLILDVQLELNLVFGLFKNVGVVEYSQWPNFFLYTNTNSYINLTLTVIPI